MDDERRGSAAEEDETERVEFAPEERRSLIRRLVREICDRYDEVLRRLAKE